MEDQAPSGAPIVTDEVDTRVRRDQAGMVLRSIEQGLARLFGSLEESTGASTEHEPVVSAILARESQRGREIESLDLPSLVQAAYFDELLALMIRRTVNRPENVHLRRLKELFDVLHVGTIRNAIAHPNRSFSDHFWYCIAAVATDSSIENLDLAEVREAFALASLGRITPPPDGWYGAPQWQLPNNLPEHFDHTITGLIGRNRELGELLDQLRNPRSFLLAITSPGGLGKTALLLEALRTIAKSPESLGWVDKIFYATSKTESLTSDGIVRIDKSYATLSALKRGLALWLEESAGHADQELSFEQVCNDHAGTRLLLCLDNLETLLRDDPQSFRTLYKELPPKWRVVVTSRVPVSSAEPLQLGPLEEGGARKLAATYVRRRAIQTMTPDLLKKTAEACERNPLAIRLSIDAYSRGGELADILTKSKQKVVEFAYKSLIETLGISERMVLECLFLAEEPLSREHVGGLLDHLTIDELAAALSTLVDTSLVSRNPTQTEDLYSVSSSVRDFLLLNPLDQEIRTKIIERMRRLRAVGDEITIQQRERQATPLDWNYVSESTPQTASLAYEAIKALGTLPITRDHIGGARRAELIEVAHKLRQAISSNSSSPLSRLLGIYLVLLGDPVRGKQSLRQATDDKTFDAAAALFLARQLRNDNELEAAAEAASKLMVRGWADPSRSNSALAADVTKEYWLPRIWLNQAETAIDGTADWRKQGPLRVTLGTLHVQAWRRLVQYKEAEFETGLLMATSVLDELIMTDGYVGYITVEAFKLIDQIAYHLRRVEAISLRGLEAFTGFVDRHLVSRN